MADRWREGTTTVVDDNLADIPQLLPHHKLSVHRAATQYLATRQNETEVRWSEPMTSDDDQKEALFDVVEQRF